MTPNNRYTPQYDQNDDLLTVQQLYTVCIGYNYSNTLSITIVDGPCHLVIIGGGRGRGGVVAAIRTIFTMSNPSSPTHPIALAYEGNDRPPRASGASDGTGNHQLAGNVAVAVGGGGSGGKKRIVVIVIVIIIIVRQSLSNDTCPSICSSTATHWEHR